MKDAEIRFKLLKLPTSSVPMSTRALKFREGTAGGEENMRKNLKGEKNKEAAASYKRVQIL